MNALLHTFEIDKEEDPFCSLVFFLEKLPTRWNINFHISSQIVEREICNVLKKKSHIVRVRR